MTIDEAKLMVQRHCSNINAYHLKKDGSITVIQQPSTSPNMWLFYESEPKVSQRYSFGSLFSPVDVDIDITNPIQFDYRSDLDKKKKIQIYNAYKRQFLAVNNQLQDYKEVKNQEFKIAEEATGAALATAGIVITLVFPPAGGLGLLGGTITGLSACQALYGWIRTFIAKTDYEFLEILEKDKELKKVMQVIDLVSVIYALKGLPKAAYSSLEKLEKLRFDKVKVRGIINKMSELQYELRNLKISMKNGIPHYPFVSNVEAEIDIVNRINLLESQWKMELDKANLVATFFKSISKDLPRLLSELLDMSNFSKFFNDGAGALIMQFFSLLANATEGHGVATGTLNEVSKGESIVHETLKREVSN